jgi:hypothetical protein
MCHFTNLGESHISVHHCPCYLAAVSRATGCQLLLLDSTSVSPLDEMCPPYTEAKAAKCSKVLPQGNRNHILVPVYYMVGGTVFCIASRIYHQSKDQVSEEDSNTLHAQPIEEVMKWMKRHLDAYLATATVYLEQNVDPG